MIPPYPKPVDIGPVFSKHAFDSVYNRLNRLCRIIEPAIDSGCQCQNSHQDVIEATESLINELQELREQSRFGQDDKNHWEEALRESREQVSHWKNRAINAEGEAGSLRQTNNDLKGKINRLKNELENIKKFSISPPAGDLKGFYDNKYRLTGEYRRVKEGDYWVNTCGQVEGPADRQFVQYGTRNPRWIAEPVNKEKSDNCQSKKDPGYIAHPCPVNALPPHGEVLAENFKYTGEFRLPELGEYYLAKCNFTTCGYRIVGPTTHGTYDNMPPGSGERWIMEKTLQTNRIHIELETIRRLENKAAMQLTRCKRNYGASDLDIQSKLQYMVERLRNLRNAGNNWKDWL